MMFDRVERNSFSCRLVLLLFQVDEYISFSLAKVLQGGNMDGSQSEKKVADIRPCAHQATAVCSHYFDVNKTLITTLTSQCLPIR